MSSVVIILGHALMPAAPLRPRQDLGHGLLQGQDEPPQEPPNLRDTQGEPRPRWALNPVRPLGSWGDGRLFFNASTAIAPARKPTNKA
jgi:hypothetical protein